MTNILDLVLLVSEGNPGAATFCMEAMHQENAAKYAIAAIERMKALDITGDKLYMVWNDCCNRDTEKTLTVMLEKSQDDLIKHLNYENGRGIPFE